MVTEPKYIFIMLKRSRIWLRNKLCFARGCPVGQETTYPGALNHPKGAVPVPDRGLEYMAPTCSNRRPGVCTLQPRWRLHCFYGRDGRSGTATWPV